MGIPIPFSNLGQVIKDVVVSAAVKQIQYVKVNVEQVRRVNPISFNNQTSHYLSNWFQLNWTIAFSTRCYLPYFTFRLLLPGIPVLENIFGWESTSQLLLRRHRHHDRGVPEIPKVELGGQRLWRRSREASWHGVEGAGGRQEDVSVGLHRIRPRPHAHGTHPGPHTRIASPSPGGCSGN